jgi:hypothetical protein
VATVSLGYECRPQFEAFHRRRQRWACLVAHRRAGKTVACVADLIDAALRCNKPEPRFAYVAPLYVQAKDVAWAYVKKFTAAIPGVEFNEAELRVDLPNGARVRLYGADNYDRLRGIYLDGVILDEYADWPPAAWSQVISACLADRQGWAVFIGTPKGRNAFFEIWDRAESDPDWFRLMLRASETGLLSDEELDQQRATKTPEEYEQEFECSFDAAILGAYFGREVAAAEREGRIRTVPYQPGLPVYTAWDLGKGANMAVWVFQTPGRELHVIDCVSGHHDDGLPQVAAVLDGKPYAADIKRDWVPHDARAVEIGTGKSRVETLAAIRRRQPSIVPNHGVDDGINAVRVSFKDWYFDAEACKYGLEALRNYRAEYDEKARTFRKIPKHDWTSHYADAARYMAMAWREMAPAAAAPKPRALPGQVLLPGAPVPTRGVRIKI